MSNSSSKAFITASGEIASRNRGPITTVFRHPTSCLETLSLDAKLENIYFGHLRQGYFDPSCFPTATAQSLDWALYYCPTAQQYARVAGVRSKPLQVDYLGSTPTCHLELVPQQRYAVPRFLSVDPFGYGHKCSSQLAQNQVVSYLFPTPKGAGFWERGPVSTSTYASPGPSIVTGDGVVILWQQSDQQILGEALGVTPTSMTRTESINFTPTSTSTFSPSIISEGLSDGAKVGVGIGIPIAVAAAAVIGWVLIRRRMGRKICSAMPITEPGGEVGRLAEVSGVERPKEIQSVQEPAHELP